MPPQPPVAGATQLSNALANETFTSSPLANEIAKGSMLMRLLKRYGGPDVTNVVERIPQTAQAALELFGPQADVLAMKESSSEVARALQDHNLSPIDKLREALIGSAYTAAAIPMMALPGTVKYKYRGSHQTPSPEEGAARLNEFGYFPTSSIETSRRGNVVEISKIETPKDLRGKGLAEQELQNLVNKADDEGLVLALTPSDAFGASKSRLEKWYKRHGFVRNAGRNKNFATRESYVRQPTRNRNP